MHRLCRRKELQYCHVDQVASRGSQSQARTQARTQAGMPIETGSKCTLHVLRLLGLETTE